MHECSEESVKEVGASPENVPPVVRLCSTREEFPITTCSYDQLSPAIYENIVVWQDDRNDNWDIYGYNLSTKEEFQITKTTRDDVHPAIFKDIVVWIDRGERSGHDDPNEDVYGCNLMTGKEFRITTDAADAEGPAIYKNVAVWMDFRNGTADVYGYYLLIHKLRNFQRKVHRLKNLEMEYV